MRLLILSDLHLEIWRGHNTLPDLEACRPDVVILAGDISTGAKAVPWAEETFKGIQVLYVHGNHEGYGHNLDSVQAEIQSLCDHSPNVTFLNQAEFFIGDVQFLGCTLWTDFELFGEPTRPYAMQEARNMMNDYHAIRIAKVGYRKLNPTDTYAYHKQHRGFLERKLLIDPPFARKRVVITHMAPSMQSVVDPYTTDIVSAAYASNLEYLVCNTDLWIHGHMHTSLDYKVQGLPMREGRVVCNPCGYPTKGGIPENELFNPNFIIEI